MYLRIMTFAGAYALGAIAALRMARALSARRLHEDSGFLFI